jgi:16S rRNA G966 N2-methylase RsmD
VSLRETYSKARWRARRGLHRLILERRYGMPRGTLREVSLKEFGLNTEDRVKHVPSQWGILRRVLPPSEVSEDDVFIDLGCGMGSVLMEAASHYRFRRVIGVDLVPQFTAVAEQMAAAARERGRLRVPDVEVVTADVTEYEIPDDVTVVFMFDPFHGEVLEAVIRKLIESVDRRPRRFRIVYCYPREGWRLERTGRARLVKHGHRPYRPWSRADYLKLYELD